MENTLEKRASKASLPPLPRKKVEEDVAWGTSSEPASEKPKKSRTNSTLIEPIETEAKSDDLGLPNSIDPEDGRKTLQRDKSGTLRTEAIFVESAVTGKFVKTDKSQLQKNRNAKLNQTKSSAFKQFTDGVEKILISITIFFNGLLAGVSLYELILTIKISNNVEFLRWYSDVASATQHVYFFLSSIALTISIEKLITKNEHGWQIIPIIKEQFLDILIILMFGLCFLFSTINAPIDESIHYAQQNKHNWFLDQTLSDTWKSDIHKWYSFNIIRNLTSLIGWILFVIKNHNYLTINT